MWAAFSCISDSLHVFNFRLQCLFVVLSFGMASTCDNLSVDFYASRVESPQMTHNGFGLKDLEQGVQWT